MVVAGAKKENFTCDAPDHCTITVRQQAERNMANTRVRELVASHYGCTVSAVRIVSGHHSPHKILSITTPL